MGNISFDLGQLQRPILPYMDHAKQGGSIMTSALDRFARVMVDSVWPKSLPRYDCLPADDKARWRAACRAALLDMAENPSEAMVEAADDCIGFNRSGRDVIHTALRAAAEPQEG